MKFVILTKNIKTLGKSNKQAKHYYAARRLLMMLDINILQSSLSLHSKAFHWKELTMLATLIVSKHHKKHH